MKESTGRCVSGEVFGDISSQVCRRELIRLCTHPVPLLPGGGEGLHIAPVRQAACWRGHCSPWDPDTCLGLYPPEECQRAGFQQPRGLSNQLSCDTQANVDSRSGNQTSVFWPVPERTSEIFLNREDTLSLGGWFSVCFLFFKTLLLHVTERSVVGRNWSLLAQNRTHEQSFRVKLNPFTSQQGGCF